MSSKLSVAVCIGCYNQGHYLEGALLSVFAQTLPAAEIFVSDDASTDGTPETMAALRGAFPTVHFFRQSRNLGVAGNNSWLLAQPKTDIIVRLDSDDRLESEYVEVLEELMRKYPRAGYAHCHAYELDGQDNKTRIRRLRPRPEFEDSDTALQNTISGMKVAANNIMYRAEAARQANYFREGMKYSEDWDLLVRLADLGWGNVYSSRILSNYRVWSDAQNIRARRKMAEVSTTIQVYRDSLEPAYQRRGWPTENMMRYRKEWAIRFTDALDSPLFDNEERGEYKELLTKLGDSWVLRLRIWAATAGFNPLIRRILQLEEQLKDRLKNLLDAGREVPCE
jgi:glycosyltransferase involved in cell wall biosynthesis